MPAVVTQRSAAAVLTLGEIKQQCRIDPDITDEDVLLAQIERAAVKSAEARIGGPVLDAVCTDTLDAWPSLPWLHLGIAGAREVTGVTVRQAGQRQPVALSAFHVAADGRLLCLKPRNGWPPVDREPGAIEISYLAGFGASPDAVPDDLRQWLRFRVATLYAYREEISSGNAVELPGCVVDSLISHYRPDGVAL
ncbi:head-tail connector protein [Crenobacter caeni]|uniref:Phage gp6-like head-tail connector protein n=1 Tax=Crenobacter caeni TaxID=2705474 RepID=A0A6B2KND3_9NEIS|nr:hypothetical protein [Crenobacter caeni]